MFFMDKLRYAISNGPENYWTLRLRLFKNDFTPGLDSVPGSFTPCDFSGHSEKILGIGTLDEEVDGDDKVWWRFATETFIHDGGGTSNLAYGWYVVNYLTGEYITGARFPDAPLSFGTLGDSVPVKVEFSWGPGGG